MQSGKNIYDGWINDSDLIGTHSRYGYDGDPVRLHGRRRQGCDQLPSLDVKDFIGTSPSPPARTASSTSCPTSSSPTSTGSATTGSTRPDLKDKFKARATAMTWACRSTGRAYEDIAEFFTERRARRSTASRSTVTWTTARRTRILGWRFTDAWLSMAGAGDKGIPNGKPVDEWGIRMPKAAGRWGPSWPRGGDTNGPAAVYSLTQVHRLADASTPRRSAMGMDFYAVACPCLAQRQRSPSRSSGTRPSPPDMVASRTCRCQRRRHSEVAHGPVARTARYWEEGMKLGYQDVRLVDLHEERRRWTGARRPGSIAQFVRRQDHVAEEEPCGPDPHPRQRHQASSRSPTARRSSAAWSSSTAARPAWPGPPPASTCPIIPKLAQLWWQNIGEAVSGEVTVDKAMDNLAEEMDKVLERIARSGTQGECGPKLNEKKDEKYWLDQPGAPKPKLANEKPKGETVDYDKLIQAWREGRVK
ncbi:MAG: carbohydrate ABC transporter substrate-binding protein [Desulfobacterales bacterium]|nr:carbohydrate ABC transporter substrate-binding protein [Desulfobacterales bacterium]